MPFEEDGLFLTTCIGSMRKKTPYVLSQAEQNQS